MIRHPSQTDPLPQRAEVEAEPVDLPRGSQHPTGPRLWLFRLLAASLPLVLLLVAEGVLRLAGVGHATDFLVPPPRLEGEPAAEEVEWVSNRRFGWRFFPRELARAPVPMALGTKDAETLRIVVLGGSAAQGVPEAAFGLARQLEALLELRHPGQRFEVINAAMTAINSHVVLPIARDLARHQPDLFVVYMGNNEVVGPFGAGSVFGRFSPRRSWIRTTLALRASRLGQLGASSFDAVGRSLAGERGPAQGGRWRGMEMFLEQRLAADDPRLDAVVEHFEYNLRDIVATGSDAGAAVVVSTVASNLLHQPPFAAPSSIPGDAATRYHALAEEVLEALASRGDGEALAPKLATQVRQALEDQPGSPRLHYALGRLEHALGRHGSAVEHLVRARDLDALRFRADSRINQAARRVAETEDIPLVDAEALFRDGGPGIEPLGGRRYFWEHVHFTPEGNFALAYAMLPAIEGALTLSGRAPTPTFEVVARHLALTDFDRHEMRRAMLALVERPPFIGLPGHAALLAEHRRGAADSAARLHREQEGVWQQAAGAYEHRLANEEKRGAGHDLASRRRWAELLDQHGDHGRAIEPWRRLTRTVPGVLAWHDALANALAEAGQLDEALAELDRAERLAPESAGEIAINRGEILASAGRLDAARAEYGRAIRLRPFDPVPRYNLVGLDVASGDVDEKSLAALVAEYRALVGDFPDFAQGHHNLGVALSRLGRLGEAVISLERAIEAEPSMASAHNSLGLALEGLGRRQAAEGAYRQALAVAPRHALAHFNLADLLLATERPLEAVAHYRAGLALEPDNRAARRNLALAQSRAPVEASRRWPGPGE